MRVAALSRGEGAWRLALSPRRRFNGRKVSRRGALVVRGRLEWGRLCGLADRAVCVRVARASGDGPVLALNRTRGDAARRSRRVLREVGRESRSG